MPIPPELAAQMEALDRDINAVSEIGYEDITDALITVRETDFETGHQQIVPGRLEDRIN